MAEESAVSAANLARAARTQAALGAAMLAAQAYNQVSLHPKHALMMRVMHDRANRGTACEPAICL